jgi:hypothetical protein
VPRSEKRVLWAHGGVKLLTAWLGRKERKRRTGIPDVLQGHIPNSLKTSPWAPPLKGPTTSTSATWRPLGTQKIQATAVNRTAFQSIKCKCCEVAGKTGRDWGPKFGK